jgi:hypothetical protein
MPSTIDAPDMPRLDVLDEEFGEGADALARARRRRTGARLSMLAGVALGLAAIGALAFAWSNADGRLRFELQSTTSSPKNAQRAAAEEEIDRLRRQVEALQDDVKELTEAQRQAAYTIATVKAAEQELRRHAPAPYWYSNPEALNPVIARQAQWAAAAPPPRRAPGGRAEPRPPRERETAAPSSPPPPR